MYSRNESKVVDWEPLRDIIRKLIHSMVYLLIHHSYCTMLQNLKFNEHQFKAQDKFNMSMPIGKHYPIIIM